MIEFGTAVTPRRWLRVIGPLVLGVLMLTGFADDVFLWFVQDKAAGLTEDLVDPMLERLADMQTVHDEPEVAP